MSRTISYIPSRPQCQTHDLLTRYEDDPGCELPPLATYDGKTVMGPWAHMCSECHEILGVGVGEARGQFLVVGRRPKKRPSETLRAWGNRIDPPTENTQYLRLTGVIVPAKRSELSHGKGR